MLSAVFSNSSICSLPAPSCGVELDAELLAALAQVGDVAQRQRIDPRVVLDDRLLDRQTRRKRLGQIVVAPLVGDLLRAVEGVGQAADRLLDPVHEVAVVGVRQVQLEHRELGVVLGREPLVAEVAVDLVDALEAADDQALQVQLRRDAQVHVQVERVVVREERARGGARPGSAASSASRPRGSRAHRGSRAGSG